MMTVAAYARLFRVCFPASGHRLRDALAIERCPVDLNLDRGCAGCNVVAFLKRHRAIHRRRCPIFIDH
jgi:hypothetical protein